MSKSFTLLHGDNLEVLKNFDDNTIDSIVTDPPYGISFMGKKWDYDVPSVEIWAECLRVLKPGGHLLAFAGTRTQHRMAVRIEDAGFEIRDMIAWVYGCLSEDSEILTKTGWKKGVDLDGSELVAQWDHETNEISFVVPDRVIIKPYVGKMVHLSNRHTDQLLTPDHRVYAKIRRHSRDPEPSCYEVVPAGELKDHWYVDIPMSGNLNTGEDVDPDYAYLVGWFLTDAWVHGDGKAVMFSQSKPHTLALLRNALSKYDHSEYTKKRDNPNHQDEHTFYVTGDIATKLINDWPERELDWRVLNWSSEARKRLLDGLIDGDGSRREHQHGHQFWSKKSHRLDIVSALYSMQGWRAYVNYKKGCVEANPKGKTQLQHKHRKNNPLVDYSGLVWCVTVPTGAFVARRNGKVFITGNSGFPKSLDVSKSIDKAAGVERTILSEREQRCGFDPEAQGGGGFRRGTVQVTAPATEAAKQWQGWGTALKPALEPITVARKPLVGTVAENVLKWGTGALNIDGCRVGDDVTVTVRNGNSGAHGRYNKDNRVFRRENPPGRWPTNLIHDGSDEVVELFPKQGDTGSAARFFYCAKASKSDRGENNNHPTVKPTALMRYLVRLVTPPNGIVLDPFMGSGSTGKAAVLEGFRFIGIELDEHYTEIAARRIGEASNNGL